MMKQSDQDTVQWWTQWSLIGMTIATVITVLVIVLNPLNIPLDTSAQFSDDENSMQEISVDINGFTYTPNAIEIPNGTRLVVTLNNHSNMEHDLQIGNANSGFVSPGQTIRFDAGVIQENTEGYCTVAGHRELGMVLDIRVSDGSGQGHTHGDFQADTSEAQQVPSMAQRMADPGADFAAFDPVLAEAPTETVHKIRLEVTEEVREVAPGRRQKQWLFNGQSPAPTLRGRVGDTFEITLVNNGTMPHSLDFHAGEVSPDEVMRDVGPGEELVYRFQARRAGIWMYHCATMPMSVHIANGMAGALIIDPADLDHVDHEFILNGTEVFLGDENVGVDPKQVFAGKYDLAAFNGYPDQYVHRPLRVRRGERIRFWIMNIGPDQPLSFHVVGGLFDTVFTEGNYSVRRGLAQGTGAQVLPLLPAQGGFVEMVFDEPGTYTFVNHAMTRAELGQMGIVQVS
ncbi:MAG: multicopper oxidase domain-containing protein [Corynebacterium sp.]|nr:multicopper oxidase domain-containing protein [Corynebacterium sp.]